LVVFEPEFGTISYCPNNGTANSTKHNSARIAKFQCKHTDNSNPFFKYGFFGGY